MWLLCWSKEGVDFGQEVLPGGVLRGQQVVGAVERDEPASRDERGQLAGLLEHIVRFPA